MKLTIKFLVLLSILNLYVCEKNSFEYGDSDSNDEYGPISEISVDDELNSNIESNSKSESIKKLSYQSNFFSFIKLENKKTTN